MPCGSILYDFVGYIRELAFSGRKPSNSIETLTMNR
jgi:hypothetical protein